MLRVMRKGLIVNKLEVMKEKTKGDIEKNISSTIEGFKPDFKIEEMDVYLYTYPAILNHFKTFNQKLKDLKDPSSEELIQELAICTLIVYGWMPTIPKNLNNLKDNNTNPQLNKLGIEACKILSDFKLRTENSDSDNISKEEAIKLQTIIKYTNGSLVGASKLLHFLFPQKFPIWDSRIYKKLTGQKGTNSIKNIKYYSFYIKELNKHLDNSNVLKVKKKLQDFYTKNKFNNIEISNIRAAELIIFLESKKKDKENTE